MRLIISRTGQFKDILAKERLIRFRGHSFDFDKLPFLILGVLRHKTDIAKAPHFKKFFHPNYESAAILLQFRNDPKNLFASSIFIRWNAKKTTVEGPADFSPSSTVSTSASLFSISCRASSAKSLVNQLAKFDVRFRSPAACRISLN